jgi:hypothetical protein
MNNGFCKTLPENFSEFGARGSGNHIGRYFITTADRIFYAFCRWLDHCAPCQSACTASGSI